MRIIDQQLGRILLAVAIAIAIAVNVTNPPLTVEPEPGDRLSRPVQTERIQSYATKSTSLDGRKYNIACGQIDIGNALTEMVVPMTNGIPQADGSIKVEPVMDVNHVAKMVLQMANLPLETNVQFVTIMATTTTMAMRTKIAMVVTTANGTAAGE